LPLRRLLAALAVLIALAALPPPAWAVREWYDHYLEARDKDIPAERWKEALANLQAAQRLKPDPALNEQTYGLQFVDYFPYYYQGLCHLKLGDFNSAQRFFNIEEARGAVKRSAVYRDLLRLRLQAQDAENQRAAQVARQEVQRLVREASDLARARKHEEALARLAQAQQAAASLDPQTQKGIADDRDRIRQELESLEESAARARRLDAALSQGEKLLADGKHAEAAVSFDEALAIDSRNARALEGKRVVQERILATATRAALDSALAEGRALFDSGRYQDAMKPLTTAAADPGNRPAQDLLTRAREMVERLRVQRDLRQQIESLEAEARRLFEERKFPEAQVRLEELLLVDPSNTRAREQLAVVERMVGEDILARLGRPNLPPVLTFFEPRAREAELMATKVSVVGIATDERGILRVEFRLGDRVVAEMVPAPGADGDSSRNVPFEREFPLEEGPNTIRVVTTDILGLERDETFVITRRLHFTQQPWFIPSAAASAVGLVGLGLAAQRVRRRRAVRRRFNPYIAGAPVLNEEMFFGRDRLLRRILNVLHHNSLMITGERRIGKTTFLYHLRRVLETDEGTDYRFFPVSIDLQGVPEESFFPALMSEVVEQLKVTPETLAGLRYRSDVERYDGRDFSHDLQRVIEELKSRTPRNVKLALLIDEVDVLNEFSERVNQRLRSIFMKTFSEHLVAVMSGVGVRRVWNSEGSPWYNFFDEIELTPFTREEAEALVREPVEGVFRWEPEAVERILAKSRLKPYVIQKYCIHAVNRMLEEGRTTVTVADVDAVTEQVRRDSPEDVSGDLDRHIAAS
jgi:tetratricopeptide (TPR) repeat protein